MQRAYRLEVFDKGFNRKPVAKRGINAATFASRQAAEDAARMLLAALGDDCWLEMWGFDRDAAGRVDGHEMLLILVTAGSWLRNTPTFKLDSARARSLRRSEKRRMMA